MNPPQMPADYMEESMTRGEQPQKRCHICGAGMSSQNPEICKNFHVQQAHKASSEQPNEYIITEKQVIQIQDEYPFTARDIRKRPHPAPATVVEDITFEGAAIVQAAKREAARKAREDVLTPLIEWLSQKRRNYGACGNRSANDDPEDCDPYDTVLRKVNSLRQQAGDQR